MNRTGRIALGLLGVGIVAGAIAFNPLALTSPAAAGTAGEIAAEPGAYTVDPVHSSVIFKIKHMGVSNFYGRINDPSGTFTLGDTASIEVSLPADKVDTANPGRDKHIKSKDFFSAKEFPEIKFSGKGFKKSGDNTWKGAGDLSFRGVTKPLEVTITRIGVGKGREGDEIAGIETVFTIKRSDFGSTAPIGPGSDEVSLIVALEGSAK